MVSQLGIPGERTSSAFGEVPELSAQDFSFLADLVNSYLGIKMAGSKRAMIGARLLCRLRELNLPDCRSYCLFLRSAEGFTQEIEQFLDLATTHKTEFFREAIHFDLLTDRVLPDLLQRNPGRSLRIWSAGCSTGEEPYTLSMVLQKYLKEHPAFEFEVLGTDVSLYALETARRAIYSVCRIRPIPHEFRTRLLLRSRDPKAEVLRVVRELKAKVRFEVLNFMDADWGKRGCFDIVFCRNVFIYFERTAQERIVMQLCERMHPGAYLFIGHSETLTSSELPISAVWRSLYQRSSVVTTRRITRDGPGQS